MPASLSTVSALTKEIYEPKLRLQLNDDSVLFSKIEKSSENVKNETGRVSFSRRAPIPELRETWIG